MPVQDVPETWTEASECCTEWHGVLYHELDRLAEKYRLPVVLCELEGRSRREVAGQLNIPEGTLSSRLATARKLLARRLNRRGVALSVGAMLFPSCRVSACVPECLFHSTARAALSVAAGSTAAGVVPLKVAALTEGVLKTMFLAKAKLVAVAFSMVALGLGSGGLVYQARAGGSPSDAAGPGQAKVRADSSQKNITFVDKDNLVLQLENAQDEVRALREALEQARKELAKFKEEAARLRDQSQVERMRAEEMAVLAQRREAEAQARAAERALIEADVARMRANREATPQNLPGRATPETGKLGTATTTGTDLTRKLAELDQAKANAQAALEKRRQDLMAQFTRDQNEMLRQYEVQRNDLVGKFKTTDPKKSPANVDKLDQLLERLERLEQRLNRLEKSGQTGTKQ